MNNYQREKNRRKWLVGVVIFILIGTAFLVTQAVIIIRSSVKAEHQQYNKGYHDAKQVYESQDFEYNEEKLLND